MRSYALGYVVCEGLADNIEAVKISCNKIYVYAEEKEKFKPELRSSGCIGTRIFKLKKVSSYIKIYKKDVFEFVKEVTSDLWIKTGGVHCSALFHNKNLIAKASDVGRHNTIDKVVGYAKLNKINLSECVLACTGRQPKGMIFKASNA